MKQWLAVAACMGGLGVLCGAFAAHGLKERVDAHALSVFETGARYQMYHALAMGLAALTGRDAAARARARAAAGLFGLGIVLFSGSLYLLALTGGAWLGLVTPLGGIAFVAGWAMLALAALRLRD